MTTDNTKSNLHRFWWRSIVMWGAILLLALSALTCKNPESAPFGNSPPRTRLANVPANDTIALYLNLGAIPEFELFWVGDDPDGFVVAYDYWWETHQGLGGPLLSMTEQKTVLNLTELGGQLLPNLILAKSGSQSLFRLYNFLATLTPQDTAIVRTILDSLETERPFLVPYRTGTVPTDWIYGGNNLENLSPTHGIFIFGSPTDSNAHTFRVRSIDNSDARDPNPASVKFWTKRIAPPVFRNWGRTQERTFPVPGEYAIRHKTERWGGLYFSFLYTDENTDEKYYSWSIDDTLHWSPWSDLAEAYVTAGDFQVAGDEHRIFVRAKNRFGAISVPTDTTFVAMVPDFDDPNFPGKILILNNNPISGTATPGNPDSAMIKQYYSQIMQTLGVSSTGYDIYSVQASTPIGAFPSRRFLGKYSSILFVSDRRPTGFQEPQQFAFTSAKQDSLVAYLKVGGKVIMSTAPFQVIANFGSIGSVWADSILHMSIPLSFPLRTNDQFDFTGTIGRIGYPNITLDTLKANANMTVTGGVAAMRGISLAFPAGFGETISLFNSLTLQPAYHLMPVGIRYLGPEPIPPARRTFSVVYFGHSLYYAQQSDAVEALRKAFDDINEIPRRP
jgi:hypothetical protein